MRNSIGLIEIEGFVGAIEAARWQQLRGSNKLNWLEWKLQKALEHKVKIEGEVSAVSAGVEAGAMAASRIAKVISKHVIARPNQDTYKLLDTYVEKNRRKQKKKQK